jgi:hypothetical protein
MGDRANIKVTEEYGEPIYLYTHWRGYVLPMTLRDALQRGQDRWRDTPYLARIIFSEMIRERLMETTGYGISTREQDNEVGRPIIEVNTRTLTVTIGGRSWAFEEYVGLSDQELEALGF